MSNDNQSWSNNPYQSNAPMPATVVPLEKPTSMTVFGILNLVWGMLGILAILSAIGLQFANLPKDPDDPMQPMQQLLENPIYVKINMVAQGLQALTSALLLVSGIGLIQGKPYGRTTANAYGVAAIVLTIGVFIVNIIFLLTPLFSQAAEMAEGPEKIGLIIGASIGGVCVLCPVIYPVLVLIFVNRAPVVNYLKARSLGE